MNNHAIDIVRALKAAKVTSRLNLRVRRVYVCAQLLSRLLTGIHLTASSNPLAFTFRFYQNWEYSHSSKAFLAENKFIGGDENAEKYRYFRRQDKMFLRTASLTKVRGYSRSDMRPLFAILGLLICLVGTLAGKLPVIKDSEAIHYGGKNVEVRGLVASLTSSPLGTAFINFGRDYPNQTFAGFIAAGSKIATDQWIAGFPGKIIGITGTIELHPR
jgi:hypothetical protein